MNIALMSHDNKKELMVQFCTAYAGILSKHTLCATATTGAMVAESTGLQIHRFLSYAHGGSQQIGARISYNEIDLVIFLCDPNNPTASEDISYMMNRVSSRGGQSVFFRSLTNLASVGHSRRYDFDEQVLSNAVQVFCAMALELLG